MAKADRIEMAILPMAIDSAMTRLLNIIRATGGVPLVETPLSSIRA